jgi:hypothetical protein
MYTAVLILALVGDMELITGCAKSGNVLKRVIMKRINWPQIFRIGIRRGYKRIILSFFWVQKYKKYIIGFLYLEAGIRRATFA